MKKFSLILTLVLFTIATYAQDVVYATSMSWSNKIKKISADPNSGTTSGSFTDVEDITASAALGADANGWLYFLQYGEDATGSENGKVDIWATQANGTGSPTKILNNFDLNGGSNSELEFVRLGIDKNGMGWILAKQASGNSIYLSYFTANGSSPTTGVIVSSNITTSDNSNSIFKNGDLAFSGTNMMYVLANDNYSNITKLYTIDPYSSTVLTYKWTLKKSDGSDFDERVNGVAFSSTGSMYVSNDDGLWFIDQNSTNFAGSGTVLCTKVKDQSGLTDLATAYWPESTRLPVTITDFKYNVSSKVVSWKTQTESNSDRFEVLGSLDGKTWSTIAAVKSKAQDGNSSLPISYSVSIEHLVVQAGFGAIFAIVLVLIFFGRFKRSFITSAIALMVISVGIFSCTKTGSEMLSSNQAKAYKYIKLNQIDKDGTTTTVSKVVPIL